VRTGREFIIASWGIAGVIAVVGRALVALTPIAMEPIRAGQLGSWQWIILVTWMATNAYAEGLVGFHRKFSPRTVDRAIYLGRNPTWGRVLLAPAFCIGLFHATRRVRIVSRSTVIGVILLVVTVRQLAQPWRGIIDAGVVVGLALGLLSLIYLFARAVVTKREPVLHQVET